MVFGLTFEELRNGLILYIILVASLCIREYGRAWTVDRLGDPNPAAQGRVTLDPFAHIDLIGTVIFPLLCIFILKGQFLFGWGKPIIPNPTFFANPKRGELLTAISGPVANLILALIASVVCGLTFRHFPLIEVIYGRVLTINCLLVVFNLIPLPPLDGGVLLKHMVRMTEETFLNISRWSFLILFILLSFDRVCLLLDIVRYIFSIPFSLIYGLLK